MRYDFPQRLQTLDGAHAEIRRLGRSLKRATARNDKAASEYLIRRISRVRTALGAVGHLERRDTHATTYPWSAA